MNENTKILEYKYRNTDKVSQQVQCHKVRNWANLICFSPFDTKSDFKHILSEKQNIRRHLVCGDNNNFADNEISRESFVETIFQEDWDIWILGSDSV